MTLKKSSKKRVRTARLKLSQLNRILSRGVNVGVDRRGRMIFLVTLKRENSLA